MFAIDWILQPFWLLWLDSPTILNFAMDSIFPTISIWIGVWLLIFLWTYSLCSISHSPPVQQSAAARLRTARLIDLTSCTSFSILRYTFLSTSSFQRVVAFLPLAPSPLSGPSPFAIIYILLSFLLLQHLFSAACGRATARMRLAGVLWALDLNVLTSRTAHTHWDPSCM